MQKSDTSINCKDLFKQQNIRYINKTEFKRPLQPGAREESKYYRSFRQEFQTLLNDYGSFLEQGYLAPCEIKIISEDIGYGLFAGKNFKANEFLGEYSGVVQRAGRSHKMRDSLGGYNTDYSWTYPVKRGIFPLEVNARLQGNELRMVNHSFEPNLRMEHCLTSRGWILFMLAHRPVNKGEQFTIDYGEEYWTGGKRELVLI